MAALSNNPAKSTNVSPEVDPDSVNTVKPEGEQKFSKVDKPTCVILRNIKHQVLLLNDDREAVFEEMTDFDIETNPWAWFIMQHSKDTDPTCLAVALSVKTPEKTYTMSCQDKHLSFKEGAAPDDIIGEEKAILFCEESLIGYRNKMHFKSLLYPQYYLTCGEGNTEYLLILKERNENEEESTVFVVQDCKEIGSWNDRGLGLKRTLRTRWGP